MTKTEDGYEYDATVGGLVSALIPIMRSSGGMWVSWAGGDLEDKDKLPARQQIPGKDPTFLQRRVFLTEKEVNNYYYGFSNQALWPLCHYFLERSNFEEEHWAAYRSVNRKFADAILEDVDTENDLLWLQDYHMALVAGMLKDENSNIRSSIFWHIPFPHMDFFRFIPWRVELLEGMLGNDVIGFHLPQYCLNFGRAVETILGYEWNRKKYEIYVGDRTVKLLPRGIGINYDYFNNLGSSEEVINKAREIKDDLSSEKLILGVDRLDYTKGIKERLLTLEKFFDEYPEYCQKVSFLQIAVPSRTGVPEYQELKDEIDYQIGRINGKYSREGWIPIHYFYRGLPQEELVAYYRAADVALITPIRDGMNLVAKEFAATRSDVDGALILGELAGVASEFPDLVAVNPFDLESGAKALKAAIEMPLEKKRETMQQMRKQVRRKDLKWWIEENLSMLSDLQ
ncbi:MAG: trehalose-6-phosphate synthase [Candidatus Marinimicrobia bacterium]|nr:trehalose-6-phosphate synthase [Candidatus Neomarinimicrobiota bacterium]MCF7828041.1 trehalose-6-phosphate synthase [Candidatus Neomarinimicrobiota bacterium]MCF7879204.1 trehalose-6-phosphate synthase [Candidatus Neomarinimicrobiota bacterium]